MVTASVLVLHGGGERRDSGTGGTVKDIKLWVGVGGKTMEVWVWVWMVAVLGRVGGEPGHMMHSYYRCRSDTFKESVQCREEERKRLAQLSEREARRRHKTSGAGPQGGREGGRTESKLGVMFVCILAATQREARGLLR